MEHLFAIVLSFKSMGGCNNIKQRNQPERLNQCVSEKAKKWGFFNCVQFENLCSHPGDNHHTDSCLVSSFQKGKALDCSLKGS